MLLMLAAAFATVIVAGAKSVAASPLYTVLLLLIVVAFFGGGLWCGWLYLVWSYDTLVLTNRRLIAIGGVPGAREERRSVPLDRVQSVEVDQRGLLMRWCGCGDLVIDVAGGGPSRFAMASEPFLLREQIVRRIARYSQERAAATQDEVRAAVRQLLQPDRPAPIFPESLAHRQPSSGQPPAESGRRAGQERRQRRLRFGRHFTGAVWRRHGWVVVRGGLAPFGLAVIAIGLPFVLDLLQFSALLPVPPALTALMLLTAAGWFAWLWADWRNDHYVVTVDRLIEIEQLPLGLRQQVTEAALNRVEDIRYRIPSPLAHLLDYGDVAVHTAGATTPFIFRTIARPRELVTAIDRQVTAFRLAREAARYQELRAEFAQWLLAYQEVTAEGQRAQESSHSRATSAAGQSAGPAFAPPADPAPTG